jgi:branched-chain amino acid transport system permease protein
MMAFGVILQIVVLRPMIGEPIISVIMVTIGLSIFFQALMKWMFGVFAKPFPPIFETQSVSVFGLQVQSVYLMSLGISLFIMAGFGWFFKYSKMGLAMRATAFNQQVAQVAGISVRNVFALSWAILGHGVGGGRRGGRTVNGVSSALSFFGIKVFPAVILGGLDSILGRRDRRADRRIAGERGALLRQPVPQLGKHVRDRPFYVLIVILMIKPYGLFGTKDIERV